MSCPKCGGSGFSISKKDGRQKPCKLGCQPAGGGGQAMMGGGGGYGGQPGMMQPGMPMQQPGYGAPPMQQPQQPQMDQNQLWQVFCQHDADRNGALEMREVHMVLQSLGFFNGLPPDKQQQLVMQQYQLNDKNRDGWLDFNEFVGLYYSLNASLRQQPQYAQYAPPQPVAYPGYAPQPMMPQPGYGGQPMPGGYPMQPHGMGMPMGGHHHHHKHKYKGAKWKGAKWGGKWKGGGGGGMMLAGGLIGGMVLAEILD